MSALSNAGNSVSITGLGRIQERLPRGIASVLVALCLQLSAHAYAQSTLIFVGSSDNPSTSGASITFSASVNASSPPGGTVNFTSDGTSIPGCSASILTGSGTTKNAYCTTATLSVGTHSIVAVYSGDGFNAPATSPAISQVVNGVPGSTTAIVSSLNPAAVGVSVTFTATVTGSSPSGTVNFTRNGTSISGCSGRALSGSGNTRTATCATTSLAVGTHTIAAAYSGDGSNAPSTSAGLAQVVVLPSTTTTLASSLNPAALGASITLTASVTGNAPTGTVNFIDGASSIGGCSARTLSGTGNTRTATCTTSSLSGGTHTIVASYSGNATNASSTSTALAQVVNAPATTTTISSSANPSVVGNSVTFTATVVGTSPTGTVDFRDVGTSISGCSARNLSGSGNTRTATCTASMLAIGTHSIVASYSGNATNAPSSSSTLAQLVGAGVPPATPTFVDVPAGHQAYDAVRALAYHSITLGCASNPMRFCPDGDVGRDEMAVFLERVMRGVGYPFSPTGTLFSDVPMPHWAVGAIEQLYADGVTLGCTASPLRFCPDNSVTRAEMAIFLLRARHGAAYNPGSATGLVFSDVPAGHWAAAWIERFAALGYTAGCSSQPPAFCPSELVTRAQMAMFLQRVFNLIGPP
jgi:hypothetical protein